MSDSTSNGPTQVLSPLQPTDEYRPLKAVDGFIVGYVCVNCGRLRHADHKETCPYRANALNQPQPAVTHDPDVPATWELVIADMRDRDRIGRVKYGSPLQPLNGRDSLVDAYQEALDLVVYLRNEIESRKLLNRRKDDSKAADSTGAL